MSIIPAGVLDKDPQTLLYFFPRINPVRYQHLTRDYHYWRQVHAAEQVAKISGKMLVPRDCLHWQRIKILANKKIIINRNVFFVLAEEELTKTERKKYNDHMISRS